MANQSESPPPDWAVKLYYYNVKSKESHWTPPNIQKIQASHILDEHSGSRIPISLKEIDTTYRKKEAMGINVDFSLPDDFIDLVETLKSAITITAKSICDQINRKKDEILTELDSHVANLSSQESYNNYIRKLEHSGYSEISNLYIPTVDTNLQIIETFPDLSKQIAKLCAELNSFELLLADSQIPPCVRLMQDSYMEKVLINSYADKPYVEGDTWFIIASSWYSSWVSYANSCPYSNSLNLKPTAIDNKSISFINYLSPFKYKIIPHEAWTLFYSWYGLSRSSKSLPRKVIKFTHPNEHLDVEVCPMKLTCSLSNMAYFITISRCDKISKLASMIKKKFAIEEEFSLYVSNSKYCKILIGDWSLDAQTVNLTSTSRVIIEIINATPKRVNKAQTSQFIIEIRNAKGSFQNS